MRRLWAAVSTVVLVAAAAVYGAADVGAAAAAAAVDGASTVHVSVRDFVFSAGFRAHSGAGTADAAVTGTGTGTAADTQYQTERFTVALLDAALPQPVWLYRPADPPGAAATDAAAGGVHDALDANAVYPEDVSESSFGLTRLMCGASGAEELIFESTPPAADAAPEARGWFVPLEPQHFQQPLYQLIASVHGAKGLVPEPLPADKRSAAAGAAGAAASLSGIKRLHFALLLSSRDAHGVVYTTAPALLRAVTRDISGDAAGVPTTPTSAQVSAWMRMHCALEFIPYGEQLQHVHTRGPAGAYVTRAPHALGLVPHHSVAEHRALLASAVTGVVPLTIGTAAAATTDGTASTAVPTTTTTASKASATPRSGSATTLLASMDVHSASDHLDGGLDGVSRYMYSRYGRGGERAYERVCTDRNQRRMPDPNAPDPLDAEFDAEAEADAVVGELAPEEGGGWTSARHNSTARERSRIGQGMAFASVDEAYFELVPLVKPILNGLLPPVKDLMVETLGSVLGFFMGRGMGGTIEMGLTDLIPKHLYKKLEGPIGHRLPPGIAEAVVDLVPPLVSTATRDYVVKHLTPKITEALTIKLDKALTQSIPFKVENPYTSDLTRQIALDVGHMLSKSLPHSLTASLVHSLTHSPLTDYYCYYCHSEQRYCEYCTYEPKQAYYAMYYAGYYTSYYADYYSRYYADVAKARNDRRRSDDIQYLSSNEHYSIVLDPSAEDSKLMS